MKTTFYVLLTLLLVASAPMWAQANACTTQAIRGTYAVTCSGFMSPAAGAPQVPFSALGTLTTTWAGNVTGATKASIAGVTVDQTVTGTAVVNSDCTGNVSYDQKINGQPAGKLNVVFVVINDGKEIRGLQVDAGVTVSCQLMLISR